MNPIVTVLMPVYNGEKYLREAIESILKQTFTDFEFLIIDDGSTDSTWEILNTYNDRRVNLIQNRENKGLIKTLNIGLNSVTGKYIARMDADDISLPRRLERQVSFMEENPMVGVCGAWEKWIKASEKKSFIMKYPVNDIDIRIGLLFTCCLTHTSAMLRNSFFKENGLYYHPSFLWAEDYELWVRCSNFFELATIPEILAYYRLHDKQVSNLNKNKQQNTVKYIHNLQLQSLGIEVNEEELDLHGMVATNRYKAEKDFLNKVEDWLLKILDANNKSKRYSEPQFSAFLGKKYFSVCNRSAVLGVDAWRAYHNSPLSYAGQIDWIQKAKFFTKCILRRNFKK